MKNLTLIIINAFLLMLSMQIQAQSNPNVDYFNGKWKVLLKGLPDGDTKLVVLLEKGENNLIGVVQDTTGIQIAKIDKVEMGENSVTIYFFAQGYDVNLVMVRKDDDHITGRLMGMFDAEGERVKK